MLAFPSLELNPSIWTPLNLIKTTKKNGIILKLGSLRVYFNLIQTTYFIMEASFHFITFLLLSKD